MEQWQIDVLNSTYLVVDDSDRLKIYKTSERLAMPIEEVIAIIRHSKKKPIIMNPHVPFSGRFAPKKSVLAILNERV